MGLSQRHLSVVKNTVILRHRNRKNYNQYFTPEFVVEKALELVPLREVKSIIDPTVGNGVFLSVASKKWSNANLYGVDIDTSVIQKNENMGLPNSRYFEGNSLFRESWEKAEIKKIILNGGFDLVVGNPPFSSWFHRIEDTNILVEYALAYRNDKLMRSQAIEVLFIELFMRLARKGGYIVIVLPDGILSNPQFRYVREYISTETMVKHIISLPRNVFEHTSAKTSILILEKQKAKNLNYKTQIKDLNKNGMINHNVKVSAKYLISRMDHRYYYSLRANTINKLVKSGVVFRPLKDFAVYCRGGKTLYGKERKFSKKGLKFLHSTNLTSIGIDYKKDEKFVSPNSKMDFKGAHTKIRDILIARVGDKCVGECAIVSRRKDMGIASDCIRIIRVRNISPYFVVVFLKSKLGREWFNMIKHGSASTCITNDEILSIPIPILHRGSQKVIENQYRKIITKYYKSNNNAEVSEIYHCFKELINNVERKIANGKKV